MTTIYLTGQNNFGNRGCEALVRSTVATLLEQNPGYKFLVPSLDIPRDSAQWPDAAQSGVRFVPAPEVPASYRWWGRLCHVLPILKTRKWPSLRGLPHLEEYLQEADAVISIGGDNYSLDYGLVSLFFFVGIAERALELGKKTALWGASVGPFSREPKCEALMRSHLERLDLISIRESHTIKYLTSIGVTKNVANVVDSAFALGKIPVNKNEFWPANNDVGVVGINISPLISDVYARQGKSGDLQKVIVTFIENVMIKTNFSVLLIPHVAPLNGDSFNNDEIYLGDIFKKFTNPRVGMVPSGMNACELKTVISECRFFIGARTHATIAAISSEVPTISIAYSIKARGINFDIFDNEDYVLPTPDIDEESLWAAFDLLLKDDLFIRGKLQEKMPKWKAKAYSSAILFSKII